MIFPKEIIENTIEVHQFKHTNNSKIIYGFILIMLIAGLVLLPFINITIYNTSQGFIRADKERIQLQSIYSGKVVFHQLKNNFKVKNVNIIYNLIFLFLYTIQASRIMDDSNKI